MKRIITVIVLALVLIIASTGTASAKTSDLTKAKAWASAHYKSNVVKVVDFGKVPKARKGVVYIEKIKTISKGGHKGKVRGTKYVVGYPKKVKRGKKVTVYLVYNPYTNYRDDVVAFIACGKII